ncbi:hypothetical protein DSL72_001435 [Monilinia vaccinii-corymbosi]|uniref:Uncharacterized protein n=1 Tax=Monilinia vaccinii-corymbosi TaxID=61207 RepID=A0A8A3P7E1_9HELO|nr:hypothetical protein DSL72_001435 [Monilinia vaccinii-corymbosi]
MCIVAKDVKIADIQVARRSVEFLVIRIVLGIGQDIADHFTPIARKIWLSKHEGTAKALTTRRSSASTGLTYSPLASGVTDLGSPSTLAANLATTSISDEDLFADMTDRQAESIGTEKMG